MKSSLGDKESLKQLGRLLLMLYLLEEIKLLCLRWAASDVVVTNYALPDNAKFQGSHLLVDSFFCRLHNILLILLHIFHKQISWYSWYLEILSWLNVCCIQLKKKLSSCSYYDQLIFNRPFNVFFPIKAAHLCIGFFDTILLNFKHVVSI